MPISLLEARGINIKDLIIGPKTPEVKNPVAKFVDKEKIRAMKELFENPDYDIIFKCQCATALIILGELKRENLPKSFLDSIGPRVIALSYAATSDEQINDFTKTLILGRMLAYFKFLNPQDFESYCEGQTLMRDFACIKTSVLKGRESSIPSHQLLALGFIFPDYFKKDIHWNKDERKRAINYIKSEFKFIGPRLATGCRVAFPEDNDQKLKSIYQALALKELKYLEQDNYETAFGAETIFYSAILLANKVTVTSQELILDYGENLEEAVPPIPERRRY